MFHGAAVGIPQSSAELALYQSPWTLLSLDQSWKQWNLVLPFLLSTICLVWASLLLTLMVFGHCLGGQGSSGLVEVEVSAGESPTYYC